MLALQVVAEAVGRRLKDREAVDVRPLLAGIGASAGERHREVKAGILRRLLDCRGSGEDDSVGHRQRATELVNFGENSGEFVRLVDVPVLLRSEADAAAIGAAAMVGLAVSRG